jgi:hypothetical protein
VVDINVFNFITIGIIAALFMAMIRLFTQFTGISVPFIS